jgi:hypothetical protein
MGSYLMVHDSLYGLLGVLRRPPHHNNGPLIGELDPGSRHTILLELQLDLVLQLHLLQVRVETLDCLLFGEDRRFWLGWAAQVGG